MYNTDLHISILGRSRNLIIRELQRTNLDVNLAVNNLLSRDEEDGDDADDAFEEDSFGFDDEESEESIEALGDEITDEEFKPPKDSEWEAQVKPKAEFVDCQCEWGLFRDRNVTMREPIRLHSGVNDLNKKGIGNVQL